MARCIISFIEGGTYNYIKHFDGDESIEDYLRCKFGEAEKNVKITAYYDRMVSISNASCGLVQEKEGDATVRNKASSICNK